MTHEDIVHWLYAMCDEYWETINHYMGRTDIFPWSISVTNREIDCCFYLICLLTENEV